MGSVVFLSLGFGVRLGWGPLDTSERVHSEFRFSKESGLLAAGIALSWFWTIGHAFLQFEGTALFVRILQTTIVESKYLFIVMGGILFMLSTAASALSMHIEEGKKLRFDVTITSAIFLQMLWPFLETLMADLGFESADIGARRVGGAILMGAFGLLIS